MEPPVLTTSCPRCTPSVGCREMARTTPEPMCCATSSVMPRVSPSMVRSSRSAKLISGSEPTGNSTSTTGPMTWTTRPAGRSPVSAGVVSVSVMSCPLSVVLGERFGAADDLGDLGGDLGLPRAVGVARQDLDELVRVVGRGLHGAAAGGVLGRGRVEQAREDAALDVARQQRVEDVLGARLELDDRMYAARLVALGPLGRQHRQQLHDLRALHGDVDVLGVRDDDLVDLAVEVV